MTEPSRTFEIERKYDVDPDTPVPDWSGIPGVTGTTPGEARALDATYFDTADTALARAGVALRRRTGGHDAGWHIKGPREGDGRLELGWPLDAAEHSGAGERVSSGEDSGAPEHPDLPAPVAQAIARWTTAPLTPLARIENARTAYHLTGPDGVIAEFVDDHVQATDLRTGIRRDWREWEIELGPAAPTDDESRSAFFAAIETAVFAAGGRAAASGSKLARALGF